MKTIPIIALVLSAAALVVALTGNPLSGSFAGGESSGDAEKKLREMEKKYAALERSFEQLRREVGGTGGSGSGKSDKDAVVRLERQVSELSAGQSELAELKKSLDPYGVIQATEDRIREAREAVMDVEGNAWARAKQADTLKRYGQFDAEALDAMKEMFTSAEDTNDKAAALVGLRGHVTPGMRDEILQTLSTAADEPKGNARLTYHGIEALEPLLPDSAVEEWLLEVAETNPEPKIAQRAANSLGAQIEWSGEDGKRGR